MKVARSRLLIADQIGARGERRVDFRFVVHLDQCIEPERSGAFAQRAKRCDIESARDQQHRVGARDARFVHLVRVDEEVLAQQRQ